MGRYYSGDIEGKFWFGIQSSDDGVFFGGTHDYIDGEGEVVDEDNLEIPIEIYHHFGKADITGVHLKIADCINELGEYHAKIAEFFTLNDSYSDERISEALGVSVPEVRGLLEWYARLEMGLKIENFLSENEECNFQAEL